MKNDKNLLQHFSREEREFVEKIMDMCQQVEDTYSYRLTHFYILDKMKLYAKLLTTTSYKRFLVGTLFRLNIRGLLLPRLIMSWTSRTLS